jgi:hypothetical protein
MLIQVNYEQLASAVGATAQMHVSHCCANMEDDHLKRKRKDYAFRRQVNVKPSIIPGCPGDDHLPACRQCQIGTLSLGVEFLCMLDPQEWARGLCRQPK